MGGDFHSPRKSQTQYHIRIPWFMRPFSTILSGFLAAKDLSNGTEFDRSFGANAAPQDDD
jgi:hypothetical protein